MTDKTKKPVKAKVEAAKDTEQSTMAAEKAEIKAMRKEIAELKAAAKPVPVKEPRQTIEAIRNDNNKLVVVPNKIWPAMYEIKREEGGGVPPDLNGQFTSMAVAEQAILRHLG